MRHDRISNRLLGIGLAGTVVAALCCFTPVLVILLGAVGLSSLVGAWLDMVLLPILAAFLGLTIYALYLRGKANPKTEEEPQ